MARIDRLQGDHYLIPLPVALEDSMHGTMTAFEVVTARVTDADGATGVGYTFTCGVNGGAVHDILGREMAPLVQGREADNIEAIWKDLWWAFHYGGRGGPTFLRSARWTWRFGTSRRNGRGCRCGTFLVAMIRRCRAMPGGSTCT